MSDIDPNFGLICMLRVEGHPTAPSLVIQLGRTIFN